MRLTHIDRSLRRLLALGCAGFVVNAQAASPYELHLRADVRAVIVDSPYVSFVHDGLGLTRFDEDHDGIRLGQLMLDLNGPLTETVRGQLTAFATDDGDQNPIDLTEAFVEWKPYPKSQWRWRTRAGAFYPPISLENRAIGWQSAYSLSASAINTWIGEEIRAIGVETTLTNVGASQGRTFDVGFVAGVYGWNDPMGVLLFQRGWAVHDRQTALFGSLPRPLGRPTDPNSIEFFHEIDNRPGYYAGVELKRLDRQVLRLMHYDNRGDPARSNGEDGAWLSRFDAIGLRTQIADAWTVIVQGMLGDTAVGPSPDGKGMFIIDYWSYFALASYSHRDHRLTARYDKMYTEPVRGGAIVDSRQDAAAWTLAYLLDLDSHWQVGAEMLRIEGSLAQRRRVGLPVRAREEVIQLAVRYFFGK